MWQESALRRDVLLLFCSAVACLLPACGDFPRNADVRETEDTMYPEPEARTRFRMRMLQTRIRLYSDSTGSLPPTIEVVAAGLPEKGRQQLTHDAWGEQFEYEREGGRFSLRSAGKDRVRGTADDLELR